MGEMEEGVEGVREAGREGGRKVGGGCRLGRVRKAQRDWREGSWVRGGGWGGFMMFCCYVLSKCRSKMCMLPGGGRTLWRA